MEVKVQREATPMLHAWGGRAVTVSSNTERSAPGSGPRVSSGRQEGRFKQKQNRLAPRQVLQRAVMLIWQREQPWHRTTEHTGAPSSLSCTPFPVNLVPIINKGNKVNHSRFFKNKVPQ